jgi:hypothetical protein
MEYSARRWKGLNRYLHVICCSSTFIYPQSTVSIELSNQIEFSHRVLLWVIQPYFSDYHECSDVSVPSKSTNSGGKKDEGNFGSVEEAFISPSCSRKLPCITFLLGKSGTSQTNVVAASSYPLIQPSVHRLSSTCISGFYLDRWLLNNETITAPLSLQYNELYQLIVLSTGMGSKI